LNYCLPLKIEWNLLNRFLSFQTLAQSFEYWISCFRLNRWISEFHPIAFVWSIFINENGESWHLTLENQKRIFAHFCLIWLQMLVFSVLTLFSRTQDPSNSQKWALGLFTKYFLRVLASSFILSLWGDWNYLFENFLLDDRSGDFFAGIGGHRKVWVGVNFFFLLS